MIDTLLILGLVIVICILAIILALSRQNNKFLRAENGEILDNNARMVLKMYRLSIEKRKLESELEQSRLINKQFENSFKPR